MERKAEKEPRAEDEAEEEARARARHLHRLLHHTPPDDHDEDLHQRPSLLSQTPSALGVDRKVTLVQNAPTHLP